MSHSGLNPHCSYPCLYLSKGSYFAENTETGAVEWGSVLNLPSGGEQWPTECESRQQPHNPCFPVSETWPSPTASSQVPRVPAASEQRLNSVQQILTLLSRVQGGGRKDQERGKRKQNPCLFSFSSFWEPVVILTNSQKVA